MSETKKLLVPFTQVPNELFLDTSLSFRARFLYCIIKSKPSDWEYFKSQISREFGITEWFYEEGLAELRKAGWIECQQKIRAGSQFGGNIIRCNHTVGTVKLGSVPSSVIHRTEESTERRITRNGDNDDHNNKDTISNKDKIKKERNRSEASDALASDFKKYWEAYPLAMRDNENEEDVYRAFVTASKEKDWNFAIVLPAIERKKKRIELQNAKRLPPGDFEPAFAHPIKFLRQRKWKCVRPVPNPTRPNIYKQPQAFDLKAPIVVVDDGVQRPPRSIAEIIQAVG